jgi:RNA polymerase sigma-70 factor (ECF subfamily)
MAELCTRYWYPLYAYARRQTRDVHEAQDLVQGFFATVLEKDYLATVTPERGRFRAFLLTAFKHYRANEWEKNRAMKRGAGVAKVPLDFVIADRRYALDPADHLTPDRAYERQWVLNLLDGVLDRLRGEYVAAGKIQQFERLKSLIVPHSSASDHADLARDLGMTAGAVAVAAHRLRRRYAELLREQVAQTVADSAEVEDEIRSLFTALEP